MGTGVGGAIVGGDIIQTPALLRKAISATPNNKSQMPWNMYPESLLRRCGDQQQAEFRSEEEEEPEFKETASEALNFWMTLSFQHQWLSIWVLKTLLERVLSTLTVLNTMDLTIKRRT